MNSRTLYLRLLTYVRPYWLAFVLALLATGVLAATEPVLAWLMKPLLDGGFIRQDTTLMWLIPVALVGIFAVRGLAALGSTVGMQWVGTRVVMDLREAMFARLMELPNQYYNDHPTGTLLSKITFDANRLTRAGTKVLTTLVRDSLIILGLVGYIFYVNWRLALVTLAVAPPTAAVIALISKRLRRISRTIQHKMGDMTHVLEETLGGHREVKIFGGQDYEKRRFRNVANRVRQYTMKMAAASGLNVPAVQFIAVIGLAVMVYFAALEHAAGALTVGGFVSFFGAMALLLNPLKRLTKINEELQKGLAAAESVFALIDTAPEPDPGTRTLPRARGKLAFENVSFRYHDQGDEVLRDVSFTVQPGEQLALVGPSGGGKSTLASLLPVFYRPHEGRILIDDVDINEIQLAELRRNIALVSQNVVLFNDTVAANIAYGAHTDTEREAIMAAAKAAHAMPFIEQMPKGLDTMIGANGVRLSGGQRQRLAIARALYKDAPILILDEATSALDTDSERQVQEALETLKRDRTTLVIAHRLSTVENADRILVLEAGRVIEQGTHKELLAQGGLYSKYYRSQLATGDVGVAGGAG